MIGKAMRLVCWFGRHSPDPYFKFRDPGKPMRSRCIRCGRKLIYSKILDRWAEAGED